MTKGSTLIETLIYIALLSILMIGVFSSVYIFMQPSNPPNWESLNTSLYE
jgi:type II secretory pathway pseudopilin PulG